MHCCNSPAVQVGVIIPSPDYSWGSTPTIQRIVVRSNLYGQQRALRLLWPASNDTVINMTVSLAAGTEGSLLNASLGLNVTTGGVALPELVPVAGGPAAAAQLAGLVRAALQLSSLDVGVQWMQQADDAVTLQVAVAQAKVRVTCGTLP